MEVRATKTMLKRLFEERGRKLLLGYTFLMPGVYTRKHISRDDDGCYYVHYASHGEIYCYLSLDAALKQTNIGDAIRKNAYVIQISKKLAKELGAA